MKQNVSQPLRLLVLGATGQTGRLVVRSALARGHAVTAVVRRAGGFAPAGTLREAVWPDLGHAAPLGRALTGVDAVISTLGGTDRRPQSVCADAMRATIPAMEARGVDRLVVVSAYGAGDSRDGSLYSRAVWAGVPEKMKDKEAMERRVAASRLRWTIVRPAALSRRPGRGRYTVGDDLPVRLWSSVSRADLAELLVDEAERPRFVHRYPRVRR
ncbi:NAD(P)-dependent oxidoreductase [Promicromonospora thailandica]|uniref:NADH-flavin reductase n=1 Tax=Promicromonospora thailandica TaxID=765201 RepID=A0A9X2G7W4_9MICO|nr:NAD(P)H-binding protein [Promicromonospora thailandica]MCP2267230.1 putative NADH-flavin reductase [Promicromonospora thailandica]BFF17461.1 SDR family oxidoreductase [Promicromonospora thailandica]